MQYNISVMDSSTLQGSMNLYKLIFQLANLSRWPNGECPHGSYKNCGTCGRFRKMFAYERGVTKKKPIT